MNWTENEQAKRLINEKTIFKPKIEDPLDDLIEIIDFPDVEHNKSMFPYVEPTVETADKIDEKQEIIDTDFIDLKSKFDKVNDVISEQKKQKEIEDKVENIFETNNFDDFWWEEDLFDKTDSTATVDASKKILEDIRPVDNRTIQEIIDDQFIPIDDRTQQELEDDDYLSFESENESKDNKVTIEDVEDIEDDFKSDKIMTIKDDFDINDFTKRSTDQLTIEQFKK